MSSAGPAVKATSGWTIRPPRPLTPGPRRATLNDCSVFSCLQLVFCFMDYSNSQITVCVRASANVRPQRCAADKTQRFARHYVNFIVWVYDV